MSQYIFGPPEIQQSFPVVSTSPYLSINGRKRADKIRRLLPRFRCGHGRGYEVCAEYP